MKSLNINTSSGLLFFTMIKKVKELMQIKDDIDTLSIEVEKLKDGFSENSKESNKSITELKRSIQDIEKENKIFLKEIRKDIRSYGSLHEQIKKELYDFKLFKSELRTALVEKAEKDFSEIKETLKRDIEEFNRLKKGIDLKTEKMAELDKEINKLVDITKNIKAADFHLAKHKRQLEKDDREKLNLLRKIDSLERLAAALRRKIR